MNWLNKQKMGLNILIISDGEPSDIDVDDNEYLIEDAKVCS